MKIVFYILIIQSFLLTTQLKSQVTLAISDFKNRSSEFYLDAWEKSVPDLLMSELSTESGLRLVQRRQLESVLQEQALSMTGLVDSSTAQKIGSLLGAEYIVTGSIDKNADWMMIYANIVKVSTGETKAEFVRAGNQNYLNEMIDLLANNIANALLGTGEYREKIEIKKYPTVYFLAGTVVLGAGTIWANDQYLKKKDAYYQTTGLSDFDTSYDEANSLV